MLESRNVISEANRTSLSYESDDSNEKNVYKGKESEENFDLSSRLHMHQVRFQQGTLKVAHLGPI